MKNWAVLTVILLLMTGPCVAQGQRGVRVGAVLVPGAGGATPGDFLIRNQRTLVGQGIATVFATSPEQVVSAARSLQAQGQRVVLIGMSAGTPTVARALSLGAPAAKVVLAAGALVPGHAQRSVMQALGGSPARLPPTLVVHNRDDQCNLTPPGAVEPFVRWAGGRARVAWIQGGGGPGQPCGQQSAHSFMGVDSQAIAAIAAFAIGP